MVEEWQDGGPPRGYKCHTPAYAADPPVLHMVGAHGFNKQYCTYLEFVFTSLYTSL